MKKQKYSKSSWIGQIYHYVHGKFPNTNSCDVRKTVLFLAPGKWFVSIKLTRWNIPLWALIPVGIQVHLMIVANTLITLSEQATITLEETAIPFFYWIPAQVITAGMLAVELIGFVSLGFFGLVKNYCWLTKRDSIKHIWEILMGWWDDFYNRVCKPIVWVD